jgi:mRNA interferase MazF
MSFMNRDYDTWNTHEKRLAKSAKKQIFNTGQVWWCAVGVNIGREEDGRNANHERPVLVFRKFGQDTFLGLPLSSRLKAGIFYADIILKNKKQA